MNTRQSRGWLRVWSDCHMARLQGGGRAAKAAHTGQPKAWGGGRKQVLGDANRPNVPRGTFAFSGSTSPRYHQEDLCLAGLTPYLRASATAKSAENAKGGLISRDHTQPLRSPRSLRLEAVPCLGRSRHRQAPRSVARQADAWREADNMSRSTKMFHVEHSPKSTPSGP